MTVKELKEALKGYRDDVLVVMCMDWTALPENEQPSKEQWEDDLDGVASAGPAAKHVYLINKNFK